MVRVAATARGAGEYEFDSPSLHAPLPPRSKPKLDLARTRAQMLRPTSGQRIGGVADLELKAQLAMAVFNFSETPGAHPLHGFTPDADGPAVTPIPVATSFRPPPAAAAVGAQPPQQQAATGLNTMPPPTTPAVLSQTRAQPIHPSKVQAQQTANPAAAPAADTPSAAHLLKTRARAALQASVTAAQTPPATNALCGLLWEVETDSDDQVSLAPMRVPKKNENLPSTHKFEINDLLDEDEDPFGW